MKSLATVAAISLLSASAALAQIAPLSGVRSSGPVRVVPNKYVVEFEDLPAGKHGAGWKPHSSMYDNLKGKKVGFRVHKEFQETGIFVGASIQLQDPKDVAKLAGTPGVKSVRQVRLLPRPVVAKSAVVKSPKDAAVPPDTDATHVVTGVDKLHAEGINGRGIKVGIIDTGVDYTHPDLGGKFGPGNKIAGGYDFVGDAYDGSNTGVPDNDPLDQCAGHGTHVAGIVGATPGNQFNISGVAYASTMYAYRIFGCQGSAQDDVIIDALIRAYNDGMDVINLSLGGVDGWTSSAASVVATKIANRGKILAIAAGNDGSYGSWYTSSPGNSMGAISIGSVDNTVVSLQNATIHGVDYKPVSYDMLFPFPLNGTHPLYATSLDPTTGTDACAPLPSTTPDLSNYVVLIRRGGCAFTQKLDNAAAKGGKYFLIYNNVAGLEVITVGNYTAALILPEDGTFLVNQLAAGKNLTIEFPQTGAFFPYPHPGGGLTSGFTSYGPTFDMYFKPAVAAPGGDILSTWPTNMGGYAVLSGTSMATPFFAGTVALLFQAKGKAISVAYGARDLFETTASPLVTARANGAPLHTVTQQGAGLIQAYKAIHTTTIISPGELLLNDTANFKPDQTFTITNQGKSPKTYSIGHVGAATALTINANTSWPAIYPVPQMATYASVTFSANQVTVNPGQTVSVNAHFTAPAGLNPDTFPIYSGFVTIVSDQDSFQVAYMGAAASLKDKVIFDTSTKFFGKALPTLLDSAGNIVTTPTTYTFNGTDIPTVLYRLLFGTPSLRADLVASDFGLTNSTGSTVGKLDEFNYIPRSSQASTAKNNGYSTYELKKPVFSNGTSISKGSYKILLRALRVTGNAQKPEDWENWLSPVITF